MARYYITGDCHGDFSKIKTFCRLYDTSLDDVLIVLGDFGLNYWLGKTDIKNKRKLSQLPITILAIHGNHEARPYEVEGYRESDWHGGIIYVQEEYPNLLFAKDGEIYDLGGKKCIAIGGAYSVDKFYRLMMGRAWFESEQPTEAIKGYVERKLDQAEWKVDYVFSHTCPLKYEPTDLFLEFIDQSQVDKSTEEWLSDIEKRLDYDKWYFGHYHGNRELDKAEMLYEEIKELGTSHSMLRVGHPCFAAGDRVAFEIEKNGNWTVKSGCVEVIDAFGTFERPVEVCYDIAGVDGVLYKHVPESVVMKFEEVRDDE